MQNLGQYDSYNLMMNGINFNRICKLQHSNNQMQKFQDFMIIGLNFDLHIDDLEIITIIYVTIVEGSHQEKHLGTSRIHFFVIHFSSCIT
jgi:hypothetical protein